MTDQSVGVLQMIAVRLKRSVFNDASSRKC